MGSNAFWGRNQIPGTTAYPLRPWLYKIFLYQRLKNSTLMLWFTKLPRIGFFLIWFYRWKWKKKIKVICDFIVILTPLCMAWLWSKATRSLCNKPFNIGSKQIGSQSVIMISLERNRLTRLIKILMSHCASPDTFFNFFVIFQCLIVMTLNFVERSCVKISFFRQFW